MHSKKVSMAVDLKSHVDTYLKIKKLYNSERLKMFNTKRNIFERLGNQIEEKVYLDWFDPESKSFEYSRTDYKYNVENLIKAVGLSNGENKHEWVRLAIELPKDYDELTETHYPRHTLEYHFSVKQTERLLEVLFDALQELKAERKELSTTGN